MAILRPLSRSVTCVTRFGRFSIPTGFPIGAFGRGRSKGTFVNAWDERSLRTRRHSRRQNAIAPYRSALYRCKHPGLGMKKNTCTKSDRHRKQVGLLQHQKTCSRALCTGAAIFLMNEQFEFIHLPYTEKREIFN